MTEPGHGMPEQTGKLLEAFDDEWLSMMVSFVALSGSIGLVKLMIYELSEIFPNVKEVLKWRKRSECDPDSLVYVHKVNRDRKYKKKTSNV